jgi:hypothetical protein
VQQSGVPAGYAGREPGQNGWRLMTATLDGGQEDGSGAETA